MKRLFILLTFAVTTLFVCCGPDAATRAALDKKLLQAAQISYRRSSLRAVAKALQAGARPATQDKNGKTALHYAAYYKNLAVCRLLLEKGADIKVRDKAGRSVLQEAADGAYGRFIHTLTNQRAGAAQAFPRGDSPLYTIEEQLELITFLLDKGADPNAKTTGGSSLLTVLSRDTNTAPQVLKLLEKKGATKSTNAQGAPFDL